MPVRVHHGGMPLCQVVYHATPFLRPRGLCARLRVVSVAWRLARPDRNGARIAVWESRRYDLHLQRIYQHYRYEQLDDEGFVVATRYRSFTLCYIWPREMEHLLVRCGFEIDDLHGWFDRRPFDANSTEQIWVARRP